MYGLEVEPQKWLSYSLYITIQQSTWQDAHGDSLQRLREHFSGTFVCIAGSHTEQISSPGSFDSYSTPISNEQPAHVSPYILTAMIAFRLGRINVALVQLPQYEDVRVIYQSTKPTRIDRYSVRQRA
jgi:hypothetical protein